MAFHIVHMKTGFTSTEVRDAIALPAARVILLRVRITMTRAKYFGRIYSTKLLKMGKQV